MTRHEALAALRAILADLYPDMASARRVVHDTGLDDEHISFTGTSINTWHGILRRAVNTHKIDDLLNIVSTEYQGNPQLAQAIERYRNTIAISTEAPSPPPTVGPSSPQQSGDTHQKAPLARFVWVTIAVIAVASVTYLGYIGIIYPRLKTMEANQTSKAIAVLPTVTPSPTATEMSESTEPTVAESTPEPPATSVNVQVLIEEGTSAMNAGEWERAIELCTDVIEVTQNSDELLWAYYCRGFAFDQNGENEEAITDFTKVIELTSISDVDQATSQTMVALAHLERGLLYANVFSDCEQAIPDLEFYLQSAEDLQFQTAAQDTLDRCETEQ